MPKKNARSKSQVTPTPVAPPPLTTYEEIQSLCSAPLTVEFGFAGKQIALQCRRLTPYETEILAQQENEVIPPTIKGKNPEDIEFNVTDPEFMRKKRKTQLSVRAQAVFWSCKAMQDTTQGKQLVSIGMYQAGVRDQIVQFVQESWHDDVLSQIFASITENQIIPGNIINFTSPGGLVNAGS